MVLAANGAMVEERAIEAAARMENDGTPIEELERLARRYNLVAEVQETTVADLRCILAAGQFPIVYIDRAVFDLTPRQRAEHSIRDARIHVVIPTRVTRSSVTFHDPLPPRVSRKSIRLFQLAHRLLGNLSVVCSMPENR
jgi:hypothetical protein